MCRGSDSVGTKALGALAHTATWEDEDANPALFACRDGESLELVEQPCPDETVTGMAVVGDTVVAATHRGTILTQREDGWAVAGSLPAQDGFAGGYTPLSWLAR